jgi:Major Facilitator Superfamily
MRESASASPAVALTGVTGLRAVAGATVLYLGAILLGMTLVSVPAASAYLKALHGFSDQQYGRVFLPQLLCAIAGALLAGPAVRRWSLKSLFMVALICFALSELALASSASVDASTAVALVMISTGLFGFGFGFGGGPLNGLVANLFPSRSVAAITALHLMAGIGLMVGPLFFRAFEAAGLWSLAPWALASASVVLFAIGGFFLDASLPPSSVTPGAAPSGSGYVRLMLAIAFLYALVEGAFSNWAVLYVSGQKHQSADVAATALSIFWGGLTLGRLIVTMLVSRMAASAIWFALPILMLLVFLLLPIADSAGALWLGYAAAGLACSGFFPLMVALAARPFPAHVSWIASMLTASLMVGVGAGAYLIGALLERIPMSRLYLHLAVVPMITLGLMALARRIETRATM